jgi:hypothetical protein
MRLKKFIDIKEASSLSETQIRDLGVDQFTDESEEVDYEDIEEDEEVAELDDDGSYTVDPAQEELASHIRKMLKVSYDRSHAFLEEDGSIGIQFILNKTEKMSSLMKVMNLIDGVKTDSLIEYDTDFELWKTTKGDPMITVTFRRNEGVRTIKRVIPF